MEPIIARGNGRSAVSSYSGLLVWYWSLVLRSMAVCVEVNLFYVRV